MLTLILSGSGACDGKRGHLDAGQNLARIHFQSGLQRYRYGVTRRIASPPAAPRHRAYSFYRIQVSKFGARQAPLRTENHGAFWTMVGTLGAQLVSTRQVGRATAIIFGGVSAASVIGVPLVNLISNHGGWRVGFTCLAVLSLLTGLALAALLPRTVGSEPLNRSVFKVVLSNKQLRRLYAIAALPASAIYVAIFNGAIGTGAFVGAGILDDWGVGLLCTGATALSLISLAVVPRLQVTSVGGASGAANGTHEAESTLEKQA
ncbi:MFS transporter [Paraburkholderia denitrificans]|uniref:MFS transporter n=1 Tax=Paraburkholderia denitrificans TaxID=694025 RepID=A0ABW0JDD4_9BURK